ncbi:MAG: hypothetical protein JNK26_03780 [Candidatus Doudnabacteria bacterium]|nr:hypothetical protein [Candidatus Doudnabacteria bacterium]
MLYLPSIKQERLKLIIDVKERLLALFQEPSSIPNGETTKLISIGTSGIHIQVTFFNLEENPFFAVTELFTCGGQTIFHYPFHPTLDIPYFDGDTAPDNLLKFKNRNWPFEIPEQRLNRISSCLAHATEVYPTLDLYLFSPGVIGRERLTPPVFEV